MEASNIKSITWLEFFKSGAKTLNLMNNSQGAKTTKHFPITNEIF